jgi:hypothetical protein
MNILWLLFSTGSIPIQYFDAHCFRFKEEDSLLVLLLAKLRELAIGNYPSNNLLRSLSLSSSLQQLQIALVETQDISLEHVIIPDLL